MRSTFFDLRSTETTSSNEKNFRMENNMFQGVPRNKMCRGDIFTQPWLCRNVGGWQLCIRMDRYNNEQRGRLIECGDRKIA